MIEAEFSKEQLSDAENEGYKAYLDGLSQNDNPYNNNEEWPLLCAWKDGFYTAADDD